MKHWIALSKKSCLFSAIAAIGIQPIAAWGQSTDKPVDNGTDPTKFPRSVEAKYEYLDLNNNLSSGTLRLSYVEPLGMNRNYQLRVRVPVTDLDGVGSGGYDLGDASLQLSHVFGLTKQHGFVWQVEAVFDTAARPELGTGQNVLKGTLIYALFLKNGAIFAPAVVQSNSISGDSQRADVNSTTFDFYYVPKLADPRNLVTFDPAINFDWVSDKEFFSLAVTVGRVIGPAFGGNQIVSVKPTVFAGSDKPGSWGIEVGYKILGF